MGKEIAGVVFNEDILISESKLEEYIAYDLHNAQVTTTPLLYRMVDNE